MIRWNWTPEPDRIAFVDFETQSVANLREVGSHAYVADPSTRLMSAVWIVPGREPIVYRRDRGGDTLPPDAPALAATHTWIAHNAEGFDAMLWAALFPDICPAWIDTAPLCRAAGFPASLDGAAEAIGLPRKDDDGSRVMMMLSRAKSKNGVAVYPVGTSVLWDKLIRYNVRDVEILAALWEHVAPVLAYHAATLAIHSAINERGIEVDRRFAMSLAGVWDAVKQSARDEIADATGGKLTREKVSSGPAVHAWLRSVGVDLATLRREEVEALLADPDALGDADDDVAALVAHVLRLRFDVVRAASAKVGRLIHVTENGTRLRGMFTYHGAGPGRWSSRVVQVHNLPRGADGVDVESLTSAPLTRDAILAAADAARVSASDVLASLIRPCFVPRDGHVFGILDYASVEARCVAWLANETTLLELFASGGDPYRDLAASLFGCDVADVTKPQRQVGKVGILGCGYSMGAAKLAAYCRLRRIDLAAAGTSAESIVTTYRERYAAIPKLWRACEDAAMDAVKEPGREFRVSWVAYRCDGSTLRACLPSGREIVYRGARVELDVPAWARMRGMNVPPRDCLKYRHHHGYTKTLYGGLLVENLSQGICRDLLADALPRIPDVVAHVHDEIVAEFPAADAGQSLRDAAILMSTPPEWATGFPVEVEGFTAGRYVKSAPRDAVKVHARGGMVL